MNHYTIEEQFKRYPRLTLPGHKASVHSIRWNCEGNLLASGGKDRELNLHRVGEGELILDRRYSNNGHTGDIDQLCWCPNDPNLVATASIDKTVKIWDARIIDPVHSIKLKDSNVNVCWSSSAEALAIVDKSDLISFIDTRDGFKVSKDQKFQFEIGEIAWNKEGDLFFITSADGKIHVLSYPSLQTLIVIDAFASPCVCIRFDPSGDYFAVGSNDAIASIWDAQNLACTQAIERPDWPVKTVSFSYDSRYLASGSEDSFIDIADVLTGEQVTAVEVNFPTLTLDFHPKEYILAYALNEKVYPDHRDLGSIKVVGFP